MIRLLVAQGLAAAGWAVTADDLLTQVQEGLSPADRRDPSSGIRAESLAAVLTTPGLSPGDRLRLRLALSEAWLEARIWAKAQTEAATVAAEAGASPEDRERAALTWLTAWAGSEATDDPLLAVAALGVERPRVAARALSLRAKRRIAAGEVAGLADLDSALKALAAADPAERVPLLVQRITAMESLGQDPAAAQAWLAEQAADPAVALVGGTTGLMGRPAPALVAPRRDGTPGSLDLATWKGTPVLVAFVASWSEACAALPARMPTAGPGLKVLYVVLDGPETVAGIPGWAQRHGVTAPIIGEGKGWDGDLDDAWRVEQIPTLVLVNAAGAIVAQGEPANVLERFAKKPAAIPKDDTVIP